MKNTPNYLKFAAAAWVTQSVNQLWYRPLKIIQCVLLWHVPVWYTCPAVLCLLCYMKRRKLKDVIILQRKEVQVSSTRVSYRKQSSTSAAYTHFPSTVIPFITLTKGNFLQPSLFLNLYSHRAMSQNVCRWLPQRLLRFMWQARSLLLSITLFLGGKFYQKSCMQPQTKFPCRLLAFIPKYLILYICIGERQKFDF